MKLQGEHEALKNKHAEDNGKLMFLATNQETKSFHHVTLLMVESAEAAKKAFKAKVKESDDFVNKMKKEIEQAEKHAKEKKALENQVAAHKKLLKNYNPTCRNCPSYILENKKSTKLSLQQLGSL